MDSLVKTVNVLLELGLRKPRLLPPVPTSRPLPVHLELAAVGASVRLISEDTHHHFITHRNFPFQPLKAQIWVSTFLSSISVI